MSNKLNFCITVFLLLSIKFFGQPINPEKAEEFAINIFSEIQFDIEKKSIDFTKKVLSHEENTEASIYIFNEKTDGFVILSSDKRAYPIIAYSDKDNIDLDNLPPALEEMLLNYINQIDLIINSDLSACIETKSFWGRLEKGEKLGLLSSKTVSPLLSTAWNQGCGYNAHCPEDSGGPCGRVWAGCVATAMGQVMRHNEHPESGVGSHCYNHHTYGEQCADFENAIYDYSSMPDDSANDEVAKLLYHCGVSVNMSYSPSGSGAFSSSVVNAWRNYFDYTNMLLASKNSYSDDAWHRILQHELHEGRPMYYAGSGSGGHAFIVDGYQNTDHYHIDWGWGGTYNGYFYLTSLNPGSADYTNSQRAIVGVIPKGDFEGLDFSSSVELMCATPQSGDISTGTNYVNYYKNTWPSAIGKELVYHFETTLPGRIRIRIDNNIGGNVNTFLLSHAHKDSLIMYGTNGLIVDNMEPGTYYIAVEGVGGEEPTFDIEVICPTIDADLIIENPYVSHQFIESELDNVIFKSVVKNIGNTAAASCDIEYFLSEDDSFDFDTDIFLGQDIVPALDPGESVEIETILSMPDGLTPGTKYFVFNVDRLEVVPESDNENLAFVHTQVPEPGLLDCSSAVTLEDGVWYWGNTTDDGENNVEDYLSGSGTNMTGPEVIHSFVSPYSGPANISFVDKSPGKMAALVQPICNENTYFASLWMANIYDTIVSQERYVTANTEYFIVVDGQNEAQGDYGLLVEMPKECPELTIEYSSSLELCEGDWLPSLWTNHGFSEYKWYKDGVLISDHSGAWLSPTDIGEYHVEVSVNSCTVQSDTITIKMDFPPDTAQITNNGPTEFCYGGSVELELDNDVFNPINWAKDGDIIPGAIDEAYTATESGVYSLMTINGACKVDSENQIEVIVNDMPADIGEPLPVPSDEIKFYYTFDYDNSDQSDNNYTFSCWDFMPANDRYDNFWQARYFTPDDIMGYVMNRHQTPDQFTLTYWFKTSSGEGGLMSGFVDSPWSSGIEEAIVYMSDDGRIHFYMSNDGSPVELNSIESYNDDQWYSLLIMYDEGIYMDINNGDEILEHTPEVLKEEFQGYWTFGGSENLPADISSTPTSNYMDFYIDDILCIYGANKHIQNYNNIERFLDVELISDDYFCENGEVNFSVNPSQYDIEYKVWNNNLSDWSPLTAIGDGEDITIGGETINETTEFVIYATNNDTGCEIILDTIFEIEVLDIETPTVTIDSDAPATICEGLTVTFTADAEEAGASPVYEWYVDGALQTETSDEFDLIVNEDVEVYAKVFTDNPCATTPEATSDVIELTTTESLEPEISIISNSDEDVCENADITFTANTNNVGGSPSFEWYVNGVLQTETSDEFSIFATENIEVYAIVFSDYECPTEPSKNSDTLEVIVHDIETPTVTIDSDAPATVCEGSIVTFTADAEEAGTSPVYEWYVNGVLQTETSNEFDLIINEDVEVYSIVFTDNPCAITPDATSNTIELEMTSSLEPQVDIVHDNDMPVCVGTEISFTANYEDAGTSPDFQWYRNGMQVGDNSDELYIDIFENDEIYVELTSSYICPDPHTVNSDTVIVSIYPDNSFTLPEDTLMCIGEVLEVSVDDIYETYEWEVGDGDQYGNQPSIIIEYLGYSPIPVRLTTTDSNDCEYYDIFYVAFVECTNIDEIEEKGLLIFPNPTDKVVNVVYKNIIKEVSIYDISGREMYNKKINEYKHQIDVSGLIKGTYFIEIRDINNALLKSKLIIK